MIQSNLSELITLKCIFIHWNLNTMTYFIYFFYLFIQHLSGSSTCLLSLGDINPGFHITVPPPELLSVVQATLDIGIAKHKDPRGSMTWRPSVYCGSLLYKLISSGSSRSPRHTASLCPLLLTPSPTLCNGRQNDFYFAGPL